MGSISKNTEKYLTYGLESQRTLQEERTAFHRHDELELMYVECGEITHMFGAQRLTLREGQLAVFWGAVPHLPVEFIPKTILNWLTVPVALFLQWRLPKAFTTEILRGKVFTQMNNDESPQSTLARFTHWNKDLSENSAEHRQLVLLECEAFIRRLLLKGSFSLLERQGDRLILQRDEVGRFEMMLGYIARHYTESLNTSDIAQAAGLHPDYAGALFRRTCGVSIMKYVIIQRLSHAQRQLVSSNDKIIDIAFASGFGSVSRFYAVFLREYGQTPQKYRQTMVGLLRS